MAKGITYTGTANDGTPLHRYSAGHIEPQYTHAVVDRGATGGGSFAGSLALARGRQAEMHRHHVAWANRNGKPVPALPEIVPLTAYPGKTKR